MRRIKDICNKCQKYLKCSEPCYPIAAYLKRENKVAFEREQRDRVVVYPSHRIVRESDLKSEHEVSLQRLEESLFSTENELPWASGFDPQLVQTKIFIQRFFENMTDSEIAEYHQLKVREVQQRYHQAVSRIFEILALLDSANKKYVFMDKQKQSPKAIKKAYYKTRRKNPEQVAKDRERSRKYREKNREKVMEMNRVYREKNKDKLNTKRREQRKKTGTVNL